MCMLLGGRGNLYFVFTPFCRIFFTCCLVVWCFSCLVVMDVVSWVFCWLFCGSTNQHSSSSAPLQGALWLNRLRSSGWISSSQEELLSSSFLNCLSDLWPYNGWVVSLISTFCFLCGRCDPGIEEIFKCSYSHLTMSPVEVITLQSMCAEHHLPLLTSADVLDHDFTTSPNPRPLVWL